MNGLLTDLYELTMSAGYFAAGKAGETGTFELSIRRLPPNRNFVIAAGLAQVVDYLQNFSFSAEEIDYLRGVPQLASSPAEFFDYLRGLRFSGDLFAVPEGTPVFAGEPVLTVRAPLIEAQMAETYLLASIGFQTLVATKAARIVETAAGRTVVEFGTRRAHSPEAGVLAGRAAYIGGCIGTSNTLTLSNLQFSDAGSYSVVVHNGTLFIGTINNANAGEIWQLLQTYYLPLVRN